MAGLAAARTLTAADASVVVFESTGLVGGKLRRSEVAGVMVDEGADSMLRRIPYGVELASETGLELISPTTGAGIWTRGEVRPMPAASVMGVPTDLKALAASGVISKRGLARARLDLARPGGAIGEDVSVGGLVAKRVGREIVDRLVDPLLGGVYAGRADQLSLQATLPQLWLHMQSHGSLIRAARAAIGTPTGAPVFAGIRGGLGLLPEHAAQGLDVRLGTVVTSLGRDASGWRLGEELFDAVVLAVPAAPAAKLLAGHAPVEELQRIRYASVGIVTLALDGPSPGKGTGFLVPAVEGRTTKAVTFTSRKWSVEGPAIVRASVGRYGEEADLQRDDDDLVRLVLGELEQAVGPLPPLMDSRVTRWGGALPQYEVGHVGVVERLRTRLPAGIAVAGAAYDGVGVPAVIGSGQRAAQAVLAGLRFP